MKLDMNALMKQAQQMQEQMLRAPRKRRRARSRRPSAGGGMVTVKASGAGELVEIRIDRDRPRRPRAARRHGARRVERGPSSSGAVGREQAAARCPTWGRSACRACRRSPSARRPASCSSKRSRALARGRRNERTLGEGRSARRLPEEPAAGRGSMGGHLPLRHARRIGVGWASLRELPPPRSRRRHSSCSTWTRRFDVSRPPTVPDRRPGARPS